MKKVVTGILMSIVSCSLMVMVFLLWYTVWWSGEQKIGTFVSIAIVAVPAFIIYLMLENFIVKRTNWNGFWFTIFTILVPMLLFIIASKGFSGEHINQVVNIACTVLSACLLVMRMILGLLRISETKKQRRKK